jgi:hypothetical protein
MCFSGRSYSATERGQEGQRKLQIDEVSIWSAIGGSGHSPLSR